MPVLALAHLVARSCCVSLDPSDGRSPLHRRVLPTLPAGAMEHLPCPTDSEPDHDPVERQTVHPSVNAIVATEQQPEHRPVSGIPHFSSGLAPALQNGAAPPAAEAGERIGALDLVRREALALGFCAVGVTSVDRLTEDGDRLRGWLALGYQGAMQYLTVPGRETPSQLLECARSIVSVALDYGERSPDEPEDGSDEPRGRIARYALGPDYHGLVKARLRQLADRLASRLGRTVVARPCVDTAPLLERGAAERSGLGFVGKNTLLIIPGVGSTVVLGELLVDLELPRGTPLRRRCGRCTACLDACPTGALVSPYLLDARRCISYLTIEHRGAIPRDLRAGIGDRIYGCDICQNVCPWNRGRRANAGASAPAASAPPRLFVPPNPKLIALLEQRSGDYRRLVRGTALGRASREQLARNAAIALGNSGSPAALGPLSRALTSNPSPVIRGHAAWALGQLPESDAEGVLERAASADSDPEVRSECLAALAFFRQAGRPWRSPPGP